MDYKDREGTVYREETGQDRFLQKVYNNKLYYLGFRCLTKPVISKMIGFILDSQASCFLIDPFIRKNQIDLSEYVRTEYHSFNEYFSRQIKHRARPIDMDPAHLISSSDGKLSVYPIRSDSVFEIKGTAYSLQSLLKSKRLAERYQGGYCIINRLTVDNYHRYSYPDSGYKSDNIRIPGVLHTVNPAAFGRVNVYKENAREYTLIRTEQFGTILQMEVGAMLVGRIRNHQERGYVHKGFEKGYFEYGGSTIITLVQKDRVKMDTDLLENTDNGYETLVKMGEKIGVRYESE